MTLSVISPPSNDVMRKVHLPLDVGWLGQSGFRNGHSCLDRTYPALDHKHTHAELVIADYERALAGAAIHE